MSIRSCRVSTGLLTTTGHTIDDERTAPAIAIRGMPTNAVFALTAAHTITRDGALPVSYPVGTTARIGDGSPVIDTDAHAWVVYVGADGTLACCAQEHLVTIAAGADVWPTHYLHAPDRKRYQPRRRGMPDLVWTTRGPFNDLDYTVYVADSGARYALAGSGLMDRTYALCLIGTRIWGVGDAHAPNVIAVYDRSVTVIDTYGDPATIDLAVAIVNLGSVIWVINTKNTPPTYGVLRYNPDGTPYAGGHLPAYSWSSGFGPGEVVALDAALIGSEIWVCLNNPPNNVVRLDATGTVLGFLTVSPFAIRIANVGGNAWVDDHFGTMHVLDPGGTEIASFALPGGDEFGSGGGIVVVGGAAWVGIGGGFFPAVGTIAVFTFGGTLIRTQPATSTALQGAMVYVPGGWTTP